MKPQESEILRCNALRRTNRRYENGGKLPRFLDKRAQLPGADNLRFLQQFQPEYGLVGLLQNDPELCHKFSS